MPEQKATNVIVVPARKTCRKRHECGAVEAASRRTRDDFVCLACGHAAHADLDAARNIRDRALRRIVPVNETTGTDESARAARVGDRGPLLAIRCTRRNRAIARLGESHRSNLHPGCPMKE
ncbi:MAG: transposase [Boseongicola sp. SB0670_bin_30]|nr:transposase [Boseongicola sp. SB0670_bin_30]